MSSPYAFSCTKRERNTYLLKDLLAHLNVTLALSPKQYSYLHKRTSSLHQTIANGTHFQSIRMHILQARADYSTSMSMQC